MKHLLFTLLLVPLSLQGFTQQYSFETKELPAIYVAQPTTTAADANMRGNYGQRRNCTNVLTVTGNALAAVGGGLIGWPAGTALGGYATVPGDAIYAMQPRPMHTGIAGTGNTVSLQLTF